MRRLFIATLLILSAPFASAQELTEDQVKQLALQAILENPEIIMQAVDLLEQKQREAQAAAAAAVMGKLGDDPNAPVLGNPNGDVVVVEFYDYNCPYCRQAGEVVDALIKADPNVKVVYREWPILGEESVIATRASLAARNQGKYEEFHWALMNGKARASEAVIMRLAQELGLDLEQLLADMYSDAVNAHIQTSNELADALGFSGTPAFVVGDQLAPGLISIEEMQGLIAAARQP